MKSRWFVILATAMLLGPGSFIAVTAVVPTVAPQTVQVASAHSGTVNASCTADKGKPGYTADGVEFDNSDTHVRSTVNGVVDVILADPILTAHPDGTFHLSRPLPDHGTFVIALLWDHDGTPWNDTPSGMFTFDCRPVITPPPPTVDITATCTMWYANSHGVVGRADNIIVSINSIQLLTTSSSLGDFSLFGALPPGSIVNGSVIASVSYLYNGVTITESRKLDVACVTPPPSTAPPSTPPPSCAPGYVLGSNGLCYTCPVGYVLGSNGHCYAVTPPPTGSLIPPVTSPPHVTLPPTDANPIAPSTPAPANQLWLVIVLLAGSGAGALVLARRRRTN